MNKRTMNDFKRVFLVLVDLEKVRNTGIKLTVRYLYCIKIRSNFAI